MVSDQGQVWTFVRSGSVSGAKGEVSCDGGGIVCGGLWEGGAASTRAAILVAGRCRSAQNPSGKFTVVKEGGLANRGRF